MRLDKLAVTAQEAFQAAMGIASDADTSSVEPIHLLKALLDAGENNISAIIKRAGADPAMLSGEVDKAIANGPKVTGGVMGMPLPSQGLMNAIDLDESVDAPALVQKALGKGQLLNATGAHTLRFLPPLVCEKGDIDAMVERLNQMIEA